MIEGRTKVSKEERTDENKHRTKQDMKQSRKEWPLTLAFLVSSQNSVAREILR